MNIINLIQQISSQEIAVINKYGKSLAGNNGPYHCVETSVRNSAHWINIFSFLYHYTKDEKYFLIIQKLGDHICSSNYQSQSGAIRCISDFKMDNLNGNIGQAWAIEGLIKAYEVTNNVKYYNKATHIFLSQTYNFKKHLWTRIELDGSDIGYDKVFNHQLWFAASGFLICKAKRNKQIYEQVDDFMNNVDSLFDVYENGLLKHYIVGMNSQKSNWKTYVKHMLRFMACFDTKFDDKAFEKAYHLFDLYGFAIIYNCNPDYRIFRSEKFQKAASYGLHIQQLNKSFNIGKCGKRKFIKPNKYAYPYNSPAFEYPYIDFTFNHGKNKDIYESLYQIQMNMTFNPETLKFDRNTDDGETLTARLYELTRYLEMSEFKHEK